MHTNNIIQKKTNFGTQTRTKSFHLQNIANCVFVLVELGTGIIIMELIMELISDGK